MALRRVHAPAVARAGAVAAASTFDLKAVTLVFGQKDAKPTRWDGSATISAGTIEKIAGYHFSSNSKIDGASWQCATSPWPAHTHEMWPSERPQPQPYSVIPIGVTIYYRAPADAEIRVKLAPGDFAFRPAELPEISGIYPLAALVEVRRSPIEQLVTTADYEDDFPSIAVDGGSVWVAWQGYKDKGDSGLPAQLIATSQWGPRLQVTENPVDAFMTGVAASHGKVTVVWSERDGVNWP